MPEGDPFDSAYRRLAGTRIVATPLPPIVALPPRERGTASPKRWAASSLLPRLRILAPRHRSLEARSAFGDD